MTGKKKSQDGSESAGRPDGEKGGPSSRRTARRPVLRFVLCFAALVVPFSIYFYEFFTQGAVFESYLEINARVSAGVLRLFGEDARASGLSVVSDRVTLLIKHGCDAIFPSGLFAAAVLASPVALRAKLPGLFLGTLTLLLINLVRILCLYYTKLFRPDWFHAMHVDVWQPAFVFLALFLWVVWAVRATRPKA